MRIIDWGEIYVKIDGKSLITWKSEKQVIATMASIGFIFLQAQIMNAVNTEYITITITASISDCTGDIDSIILLFIYQKCIFPFA